MPVEIHITGADADEALKELRGLSAGLLSAPVTAPAAVLNATVNDLSDEDSEILRNAPAMPIVAAPVQEEQPAKRRGRPRKTEVASVVEAAPATLPVASEEPDEEDAPADIPVDAPAVQAQDAADEARPADAPLTTDDLRAAMKDYVEAFGMAAAAEDGPRIIALVMTGDMDAKQPDGRSFVASSVPQDKLAHAIKEFKMAAVNNPFNRPAKDA